MRRRRRDVALHRQDVARELLARALQHLTFEVVEPVLELVHLGMVVADHRVDDAMHQRHRPFGQDVPALAAQLGYMGDAAPLAVVHRHEELAGDEEVGVVGIEGVFAGVEVDAVEHDVEQVAVSLDLGMRGFAERVLDRQLVDAEHIVEQHAVFDRRLRHVGPHVGAAAWNEPRRVEGLDGGGPAVAVHEVTNHDNSGKRSAASNARKRGSARRGSAAVCTASSSIQGPP